MAEKFTSYEIGNDKAFAAAIKRAQDVTSDLTIPLVLITKDFYKSEKAIFMLKGPGKYDDLKQKTKDEKIRLGFPVYPILKRSGRLEGSVTSPTHPDAVNQIINKRTLIIGTTVEYAIFHQSDRARKVIPLRKFLFIGPESKFAGSEQAGRLQRWLGILDGFIVQKLKQKGA